MHQGALLHVFKAGVNYKFGRAGLVVPPSSGAFLCQESRETNIAFGQSRRFDDVRAMSGLPR